MEEGQTSTGDAILEAMKQQYRRLEAERLSALVQSPSPRKERHFVLGRDVAQPNLCS